MADAMTEFKNKMKESWAHFAPIEVMTTIPAGHLVAFSGTTSGEKILDVGCGTGVVSITAARKGAKVTGLDLSPALLERAKENAALARLEVDFKEGDVEALPYPDDSFDRVLSQFGHMFAPQPEIAISEMLRVLKPGGTIAFSTWPPEMFVGKMFAFTSQYLPPPPVPVVPPPQWGNPDTIRERFGDRVSNILFEREQMNVPALSPQHARTMFEKSVGPLITLVETLKKEPAKLAKYQTEYETLISTYMDRNTLRQHFLMTRARKKS